MCAGYALIEQTNEISSIKDIQQNWRQKFRKIRKTYRLIKYPPLVWWFKLNLCGKRFCHTNQLLCVMYYEHIGGASVTMTWREKTPNKIKHNHCWVFVTSLLSGPIYEDDLIFKLLPYPLMGGGCVLVCISESFTLYIKAVVNRHLRNCKWKYSNFFVCNWLQRISNT